MHIIRPLKQSWLYPIVPWCNSHMIMIVIMIKASHPGVPEQYKFLFHFVMFYFQFSYANLPYLCCNE